MKIRWFLAAASAVVVLSVSVVLSQDRQEKPRSVPAVGEVSWGSRLPHGPFSLGQPSLPMRVLQIGVLQGTWKEMGVQYGQRTGRDIAQHWDFDWEDRAINNRNPWATSRTSEKRQAYRVAYLERAWKELAALSPELVSLLTGIAEGAKPELDKSHYAAVAPNHLKILYLNESEVAIHPNWDFVNDRPGPPVVTTTTADLDLDLYNNESDGCNGVWVHSRATTEGRTLAQRAVQGGTNRGVTTVSYVAIPKDPNARVFWGFGRAGSLGGLGAMMNDRGVCVLTSGSQGGPDDESMAPGIKDFILGAYGVIFSKTAREAAAKITIGTAEYRRATGRSTVLRFRGANVVFGDANEAYVVESNARNYLVRKPGDLGEKDANYVVIANHFMGKSRYDDQNQFHADKPMRDFEPGRGGSFYRWWTGFWWTNNNLGKINAESLREFAGAHFSYDEKGAFFDVDPVSGYQTSKPGTWCAHSGKRSPGAPLGTDGNNMTTVFDLTSKEAWFVPGWTCHYREWNMNWNHVDLNPYAQFRQKVWGVD